MESIVYNEDCMIGMARYPDKYFDLAIVDPPYGGGGAAFGGRFDRYRPKYVQDSTDGRDVASKISEKRRYL